MSPALSDADYQRLAEFRHQLRAFVAFSERQVRLAGLSPAQHQLLLAVRGYAGGAPTIRALAARLVLKHHSTVELLDRLEQHRLVKRARDGADLRVARVKLTARGSKVLAELSLAHREELGRRGPELARTLSALLAPPRGQRRSLTPGTDSARSKKTRSS